MNARDVHPLCHLWPPPLQVAHEFMGWARAASTDEERDQVLRRWRNKRKKWRQKRKARR